MMADSPTFSLSSTLPPNDHNLDKQSNYQLPGEIESDEIEVRETKFSYNKGNPCLVWWFCILAIIFLGTTLAAIVAWAVFTDGFKDIRKYIKSDLASSTIVINNTKVIEKVIDGNEVPDICVTEGCVKIAAEILQYMDSNIDPCEDFYQYACSKYEEISVDDNNIRDIFDEMYYDLQDRFKLILEADTPEVDSKSDALAKTYYWSCVNYTAINDAGHRPLMDMLETIYRWPILHPNEQYEDTNIEILLALLQKNFNVKLILPAYSTRNSYAFDGPMPDFIDKPYSLMLVPGYQPVISLSSLSKKDEDFYYRRYKRALLDLLAALEIEDSDGRLDQLVEQTLDFEFLLANLTGEDMYYDDNSEDYKDEMGYPEPEPEPEPMNMTVNYLIINANYSMMDMLKVNYSMMNVTNANYLMRNISNPIEAYENYEPSNIRRRRPKLRQKRRREPKSNSSGWGNDTQTSDRDTMNAINKYYITIGQLKNETKNGIDWNIFFNTLIGTLSDSDRIWIGYPGIGNEQEMQQTLEYYQKLADVMKYADKKVILNYVFIKLCWYLSSYLSYEYASPRAEYERSTGSFSASGSPRLWIDCIDFIDDKIPMILGSLFVRNYFGDKEMEEIGLLVKNIRMSMENRLNRTSWMDSSTRLYALEKLKKMRERIGAPGWIRNDSALLQTFGDSQMEPNKYFENSIKINGANGRERMAFLNKEKDEDVWDPPQTINAFYSDLNSINFPAAFLQFPQFVAEVPKFVNYGKIGHIIGHEITHGYDNKGSWENGTSWWNADTWAMFENKVGCLAEQYNREQFMDTEFDANLTRQEDVADNGGLRIAFEAYKMWSNDVKMNPEQRLPGFSNLNNDQMFFVSFATNYCEKAGSKFDERRWASDDHSKGRYRVNIPLSNSDHFLGAFQCPLGSKMNRVNKCIVW